jgi:hypothetical protein
MDESGKEDRGVDATAGGTPDPEREPRATAREACAERCFERNLGEQQRWRGERATRSKTLMRSRLDAEAAGGGGRAAARRTRGWQRP